MPLVLREVQPIFLTHGLHTIPDNIENDLQCVTNFTLTSIIRQLSDMARLADDVFVELLSETDWVCQKSNALQDRIDKISAIATRLDPAHDQDTLADFLCKTPYQSALFDDQAILDSKTQPLALQQTRSMCDPVPPLNRLDPYREDGKEASKMYTNPKYFFELWCQKMECNIKREEDEKAERKRKRQEERIHKQQTRENKSTSKIPAGLDQSRRQKNARMAKEIELMEDPSRDDPNHPSLSQELNEEYLLKSHDEEQSLSETDPPQCSPSSLQPSSTSHNASLDLPQPSLDSSQPSSDYIPTHQFDREVPPVSLESSIVSTEPVTTSLCYSAASLGSSQPSLDGISPHQLDLAPTEDPVASFQPSIPSTGPITSPDFSSTSPTTSLGATQPTYDHITTQSESVVISPQKTDASSQLDAIPQVSPAPSPEYNSDTPLVDLTMGPIPPVAPQPPHPPPPVLPSINLQLGRRKESRSDLLEAIRQSIPLKPVQRAASLQNEESDIMKVLIDRRQALEPDNDTDSDTSIYFSTDEEDGVDNDQS